MIQNTECGPDYRVILLGASNLTLGLPRLVHSLRTSLPGTVEVISAHGHGRSYLKWSYVFYRGLPSITHCDLWSDLEKRPAAKETYALVTDLGCDLFYGAKPQPIIDAVGICLNRLSQLGAKTVFVRPPLDRLYQISDWHYYVVKNIFFPGPTVRWPLMREYITEVDQGVMGIAEGLGCSIVAPNISWFGFDPIHIKRTQRNFAWQEIVKTWRGPESLQIAAPGLAESFHTWTRKASSRKVWWIPNTHSQPSYQWPDGSSLSVY